MPEITTILLFALGALAAYLIGGFSFALGISRAHNVDLYSVGSKNPGGTNVLRTMGTRVGILVMLLDMAKGAVGVLACWAVASKFSFAYDPWALCLGALGVVAGHNWPVYHKFRGGKGAAATFGALFIVCWPIGCITQSTMIFVLTLSKKMSLSVISGMLCGFASSFFLCESWIVVAFTGLLTVILLVQFRDNIRRLLRGQEAPVFGKKAGTH